MKKILSIILILLAFVSGLWAFPPTPPSSGGAASVSDTAYNATSWDGVTDVAPSKNAVRDKFESLGAAFDPTAPGPIGGTTPAAGTFTTLTATGALNAAYATVASHATTSAIWAAAGNIINFTGGETITALPAASQAGMQRWLICAGTPTFTHAGALTVQGGVNYTAAAGDVILVTATSTTAFKITVYKQSGLPTVLQTTVTGNAGTASALAADPANCAAGQAPLGVTASGAAEGCFAVQADIGLTAKSDSTSTTSSTTAASSTAVKSAYDLAALALPKAGGTMVGNLLFTDNTYDIGASGATRPRTGYFGTSVVAPLFTSTKATGVAGLMSVYQALTTSTLYQGWMGAVDRSATGNRSYAFQFGNAEPAAGQVMAFAAPTGTGDPNGNPVSAQTWVTPVLGTFGATANTIGKRGADATTVAASGITEDGTTVQLTALNLATTGQITGKIKVITKSSAYTLGTDSATELYGSAVIATAAMVLTLPDVDAAAGTGQSVCMYSTTAAAISIDPDAEDKIRLNGVLGGAGGILTSASGAGDFACVVLTDFASDVAHWTVFGKSGAWTQP
jgi:hypothetical protein